MLRRRGDALSAGEVCPVPAAAPVAPERERRRRERLRGELIDELVPLPIDGAAGPALLAELSYARYPPVHEGRAPTYGAIVPAGVAPGGGQGAGPSGDGRGGVPDDLGAPVGTGLSPELQHRAADGRSTFLWRSAAGTSGLLALPRRHDHEADLVALRDRLGDVTVIQRDRDGWVRAVTADGVVIWNTVEWTFKPAATQHLPPLLRLLPGVDAAVLATLLDLCVHRLSADGVGATLVWWLDGGAPGGVDRAAAQRVGGLRVTDPRHHAALISLLAQVDRAAVVRADGRLDEIGVALVPSAEAHAMVAPAGGTRHSSARRWSFDHPGSVVFVVSEDGPVSIFSDGAAAAQVRADPCRMGFPTARLAVDHPGRRVPCPRCGRTLLVDVTDIPAWRGGPEVLSCPACDGPVVVDVYRAAARGVLKQR